jgi:uncharacterized protein
MAAGAQIGFHAAYDARNGQQTGYANARVGAFLNRIGLGDDAVTYITAAPPNSLAYLTAETAKRYGIDVTLLDVPDSFYVTQALTRLGVTIAPPSPTLPAPSPDSQRQLRTVQDLHLRTQPDPNSSDVIPEPAPNDLMQKGTMVRVNTNYCIVRMGTQDTKNVWCPVAYRNYRGWANAYYLATDDGQRLACLVYSMADGCGSAKSARGPSFDCTEDLDPDEVTICNSDTLAVLDRQMVDLFASTYNKLAVAERTKLLDEQQDWLQRRAACQKAESCMAEAYRLRIVQLRDKLAQLAPGDRGITSPIPQVSPNKPPELKPSERWAVIASRSELPDAISIAQNYKSNFPSTFVIQSQNGQFAVIIGPIDVQDNPSFLTRLTDTNKVPKDAYYSSGSRFVDVVWPATAPMLRD